MTIEIMKQLQRMTAAPRWSMRICLNSGRITKMVPSGLLTTISPSMSCMVGVPCSGELPVLYGLQDSIERESETVAPLEGALLEEYRFEHRRRNGIETDWSTFTGYFEKVMKGGISINVASGVSPQQIKRVVVGFDERPASAAEREKMNRFVA